MISDKNQAQPLDKTAVMQSVILPNELRIGNLLYFGNAKCKVVEIQKECFYVENEKCTELKNTTSDLNPKNINTAFQNSLKISEKLFDKLNVGLKLKEILKRIE